jgi:hypothetical protein
MRQSYIPRGFHRLTNKFKLNLLVPWIYSSVLTNQNFVDSYIDLSLSLILFRLMSPQFIVA